MEMQFEVQDHAAWPPTMGIANVSTDIPLMAAATRRRISKNSGVLPTDRVILSYQHFQNAFATEVSHPGTGLTRTTLDLDRTVVGIEKSLFAGRWSFDLRLPILSRFDVMTSDFSMTNGRIGNTSLLLKHVWYESDAVALGVGLGIDFPTGSDGEVELPQSRVTLGNDAYHALPYVGLLMTPTENTTLQAFAQFDIPLNGNEIELGTPSDGTLTGEFDEQDLLFLSVSTAYWHYQNPDAAYLRGLAGLLELHYTTSLSQSDQVSFATDAASLTISNPSNDIQSLNLTAGVLAQVGETNVRVAAVLPLLDGANRTFDAEFMLQVNRNY